jgi:hypothetical protein
MRVLQEEVGEVVVKIHEGGFNFSEIESGEFNCNGNYNYGSSCSVVVVWWWWLCCGCGGNCTVVWCGVVVVLVVVAVV